MIKHSLNRLYEGKLFGSGWPLHPQRDYPHFVSELGSTLVYDSTHIDWKASEQWFVNDLDVKMDFVYSAL